uniref:Putative secreted protein n=1 Tax=Ixodes ricinus TaxID=34613 RepID=A0A6B0U109_IXORI
MSFTVAKASLTLSEACFAPVLASLAFSNASLANASSSFACPWYPRILSSVACTLSASASASLRSLSAVLLARSASFRT